MSVLTVSRTCLPSICVCTAKVWDQSRGALAHECSSAAAHNLLGHIALVALVPRLPSVQNGIFSNDLDPMSGTHTDQLFETVTISDTQIELDTGHTAVQCQQAEG